MATPLERELSKRKRKTQPPPGGVFANNPAAPGLSDPLQNPAPGGGAYGLTNFAGTGTENMLAAFEAAKQRHQSQALNPQFAPTPLIAPNSPHATASPYGSPPPQLPEQSYAEQWKNAIPTGPQFSTFGPFSDPRGGPVDGPVPSWLGNAQRVLANKVFEGAGTAIDRTAREVNGIVGAPVRLAHQLFTPGVQLDEEAKAAQQQEQQSQPAAVQPQQYHLPKPQGPATSPSPQPTVAAPGATPLAGTTPGATPGTTPYTAPAAPIQWNALPPAALEMAQYWQSQGYTNAAIAGMLGQAAGESNYGQNTAGGQGSTGTFQHRGERATARANYAQAHGVDPNSPLAEAMFADYELRGEVDPNTGQRVGGTENYAYQQLMSAHDPYTATVAGLAYERPQGYQQGPGLNPEQVAGWNNRFQGATQAYNLLNQYPLPPAPESFNQAVPPPQPNPVDRPLPVGPDYTATNSWLNKAAPQPVDPAAQRQMMFNQLLSGIAGANAEVDTRGPGGTARLLAALGGGAARGKASGEERARSENEAFKEKQQAYAGDRAGFAQTQANVTADTKNKVSDTQWANMTDDQRTDFLNKQSEFQVGQENKLGQFNARQANRENLYKYQQGVKAGSQGELKFMGNYIAEINPDGSLGTIHDLHGSDSESIKYRALVAQGQMGEPARLHQRYQEFADAQDEIGLKKAIMEDVVASGAGSSVFQENYQSAVDEANKIMARGQMSGSGDYQAATKNRNEIISNILWQAYYNKPEGWLQNAARAQNPGAIMLVGGQ